MASELVAQKENTIIKAHSRREKLLVKLNEFKICQLTAKEKETADLCANKLADAFLALSWKVVGISEKQISKLDDDDLRELGDLIYDRIKIIVFLQKYILQPVICSTLFGIGPMWGMLEKQERGFWSWQYVANKKKLEMFYGKDFFPLDEIRQRHL